MFTLAISVFCIALGLFLLHRLALWMESKGWIYWTRSSGISTRAGNAMLEVQKILEPPKSHILELKRDSRPSRDDQGDTPDPHGY